MTARQVVLAEYLRARRSALKPEDVGLPPDPQRRVQGLRREEVAERAGISLEYYVRIEQGQNHRISEQVLDALARALDLDESGRSYLYRLALPSPFDARPARPDHEVSELLRSMLDQWAGTAAVIFDRNQDLLFVNALAAALSPGYVVPGNNNVEMMFGTPAENRSNERWRDTARDTVAALRFHADPDDPRLQQLVAELTPDPDFHAMWTAHEARPFSSGLAPNFVEGYGWVELPFQVLDVPDGLFMNVVVCEPDSQAGFAIEHLLARLRAPDEFDESDALQSDAGAEAVAEPSAAAR
ncbi:helix-turn-helix domain-containing protein [Agreia sp. Leaf244]|uniref:helix-turn-helix domain-containing protein n=1 Tax=Agreia sp. Leaf244 TaxID=1736305 RepID=UPI00138F1007|nr:helix-turn-helix transcriptional regulator [Agreia sp. Leaf244]